MSIFEAAQRDNVTQIKSWVHWYHTPLDTGRAEGAAPPLCVASANGSVRVASYLLSHGADPNVPCGRSGERPLHAALTQPASDSALRALAPVVDTLLRHGADPQQTDTLGVTPIRAYALGLYVQSLQGNAAYPLYRGRLFTDVDSAQGAMLVRLARRSPATGQELVCMLDAVRLSETDPFQVAASARRARAMGRRLRDAGFGGGPCGRSQRLWTW